MEFKCQHLWWWRHRPLYRQQRQQPILTHAALCSLSHKQKPAKKPATKKPAAKKPAAKKPAAKKPAAKVGRGEGADAARGGRAAGEAACSIWCQALLPSRP